MSEQRATESKLLGIVTAGLMMCTIKDGVKLCRAATNTTTSDPCNLQ